MSCNLSKLYAKALDLEQELQDIGDTDAAKKASIEKQIVDTLSDMESQESFSNMEQWDFE